MIDPEDNGCCDADCGEEDISTAVVADVHASPVFETAEQVIGQDWRTGRDKNENWVVNVARQAAALESGGAVAGVAQAPILKTAPQLGREFSPASVSVVRLALS